MELCPEGTTEPPEGPEQGKKLGSQTSVLPSLRSVPSPLPAPLPPQGPSSLGPWAPKPIPLTAAPASDPWRTLSSTSSQTPPPPSSARRRDTAHASHTRGRREMESTQQAEPGPTSSRASGLPTSPRRLREALSFRPSNVVPSGKCSPVAEAGREGGQRVLGNGVRRGSESLDGWRWGAWSPGCEAPRSWRWSGALVGYKERRQSPPPLVLTIYTVRSISSCRKLPYSSRSKGNVVSRVSYRSLERHVWTPGVHRALGPLFSTAVTLSSGWSPTPVEMLKPPAVEGPQSSALGAFIISGVSASGSLTLQPRPALGSVPGLRLPAPEVYLLAIPQGAPQPERGRGARGGRGRGGAPAIKLGRLPRRPGRRGPGQSDGRVPVGTRAVRAERSGALGSPRAGAGAGGGAGPGDAGLGEDGGP